MTYCNNLASYCNHVLWRWSHILLEERWKIHRRLPGAAPCTTNVTYCKNLASYYKNVTYCNHLANDCKNMTYCDNLARYCYIVLCQWSPILLEKRFKIHHRLPGAAPPRPCLTNVTYCNNLTSSCNNVTCCDHLASYCNNVTYCNNLAKYCNNELWQWSRIFL